MQIATPTLICPNPNCQYPNAEIHRFCQKCRSPLVKRYLWVKGHEIKNYRVGDLLQNRFLVKSAKVLLDTQPEKHVSTEIFAPALIEPYLKLFAYRPHIPQPYCVLHLERKQPNQEILLLEDAPIGICDLPTELNAKPSKQYAQPFEFAFCGRSALQQLNLLWQIARLWQPLADCKVVSTLLEPNLIRVEGSLVRLLELRQDQGKTLKLAKLGQMWQQYLPKARSRIQSSLHLLCLQMIEGQIQTIDQLINRLDLQLEQFEISHSIQFTVSAQTDQGPTRRRNEDACFLTDSKNFSDLPLTIVCDGMGGHAGGDVASRIAVETIAHNLQAVKTKSKDATELVIQLREAVYHANDLIYQQNNQQHCHDYQRMGTTLVMALACPPKMYIASVGDSRGYLISRSGCYQITTDDNIASHWVELGTSFYRDVLSHPESVKLTQALGVSPSKVLQPRFRELVIDEDCIFLLCSDGLSDNHRVEECWETEILPVLEEGVDLAVVSRRLIDLANHKNGHDNVTVSLVYCQVS